MENNEGLRTVIEDIEGLLDGILLSGISVVGEGTLREIHRVAVSSSEIGLKEGSAMLFNLEENLKRKRHTLNFEMDEVAKNLAVLGSYVGLVKGKMRGN